MSTPESLWTCLSESRHFCSHFQGPSHYEMKTQAPKDTSWRGCGELPKTPTGRYLVGGTGMPIASKTHSSGMFQFVNPPKRNFDELRSKMFQGTRWILREFLQGPEHADPKRLRLWQINPAVEYRFVGTGFRCGFRCSTRSQSVWDAPSGAEDVRHGSGWT